MSIDKIAQAPGNFLRLAFQEVRTQLVILLSGFLEASLGSVGNVPEKVCSQFALFRR